MKLIKLKNKFILVSDETAIEANEFYFDFFSKEIKQSNCYYQSFNNRKIIAGIPELGKSIYNREAHEIEEGLNKLLPSIDFSDLKEADCKEIGWVDVKKLGEDSWVQIRNENSISRDNVMFVTGYVEGFKTEKSLNDKMFSLDDIILAISLGRNNNLSDKEIIQSLQKTEWDVEVEKEDAGSGTKFVGFLKRPKITDGKIKVTKIL